MNTNEIKGINIFDGADTYYGADQHWYAKKLSAMSGCGPTTASIAFAYLAQTIDSCKDLYPYSLPYQRNDFLKFMEDVRLHIKPNFGPMTDPKAFCTKCVDFAKHKDVELSYDIMDKNLDIQTAFDKIINLIDNNILPSLLILRNPHKEINEYTWHWMTITGYIKDTKKIIIATYGKRLKMDFTKAWSQEKKFSTDVVWFWG